MKVARAVHLYAGLPAVTFLVLTALLPEQAPGMKAPPTPSLVVLGYNDLGMHCMNQDFSEICILPPFNNLHAQVLQRGGEPKPVTSGITVSYSVPGNTYSVGKTNFWQYARPLFGVGLAANIGLTGNGLSGTMKPTGDNDWAATGIPITPIDDRGRLNPYNLATVQVTVGGKVQTSTQAVVPVSWEINCDKCHTTPGISVATDILRKHDRMHATHLELQKPVLCARCHADPALGTTGAPGVPTMSAAMHTSHAARLETPAARSMFPNRCYACHPGNVTQCQRDVHYAKGVYCTQCHGGMATVGQANRTPWVDEPRCGNCHKRTGFEFEQPGVLFKQAKGHGGVHCAACHGSPHAITPTVTAADNVQAIRLQGFAGVIRKCTVCHTKQPGDAFFHRVSEDGGGQGGAGGGQDHSGDGGHND